MTHAQWSQEQLELQCNAGKLYPLLAAGVLQAGFVETRVIAL